MRAPDLIGGSGGVRAPDLEGAALDLGGMWPFVGGGGGVRVRDLHQPILSTTF